MPSFPSRALSLTAALLCLAACPALAAGEADAPKGATVTVLKAAKACFPAIVEVSWLVAHVVGVYDEARGQVVAGLVRAPGGRAVDVDALRARLREQLSAYKVPRRIVLATDAEVPMMSSGKVDLRALKAVLAKTGLAEPGRSDA